MKQELITLTKHNLVTAETKYFDLYLDQEHNIIV